MDSLSKQISRAPGLPGVYQMKDSNDRCIYIGKAKNLKKRLKQYLAGNDSRAQISFLVSKLNKFDIIVTNNENQAFILERELINKYKPRYNIRLKDDKAYLSIKVDENVPWPRLELVRKYVNDGANYYGPYKDAEKARSLLSIINKVVPLRTCTDRVFYNRQRPCLEYQIKRCAGPCCLTVESDRYFEWVAEAQAILEGKTEKLIKKLTDKMELAANNLIYEEAAILRDRIEVLKSFREGQELNSKELDDRDVFGFYREDKLATVCVLKIRKGRVADSENFHIEQVELSDQLFLQAAVEQYYQTAQSQPVSEVLLPIEIENWYEVPFHVPKKGIKKRQIELANINAKHNFIANFDFEKRYQEAAESLALLCGLKQMPRTIDCVDISNLQSTNIVGALVSFYDGEPRKSSYRRFKIKNQTKQNDFAAIYEVVHRILMRGSHRDLLIIDGGAQQLASACKARDELGAKLDIIGIAKERAISKPERIFTENSKTAKVLDKNTSVYNLVTKIRDEAHRFAVSYHRHLRKRHDLS